MKLDEKFTNNILDEVKQQVIFLELKDSKILSVVKKYIKSEESDINTIINNTVGYYYDLISDSVKNNDFSYIYKYIEYYSSDNDFFDKFSRFLLKLSVEFNFDMCEKILENNTLSFKISDLVNKIIDGCKIDILFENSIVKSLFDVYCDIHNIDCVIADDVDTFDITKCDDSLRVYLSEIARFPLLSISEERELLERYHKYHDEEAKNKLIESNLRLVVSRAKRFFSDSNQFLDLISEGNIGLMKAIEKFDYTKSYKLSTYAVWWIDQSITRMIYNTDDMIRIPVHIREELNKYKRLKNNLTLSLERDVTLSEISENLNIPISKVEKNELLLNSVVSLNQKIGDDEDTELGDMLPIYDSDSIEEKTDNVLLKQHMANALNSMDTLKKTVLMLRYGLYDGDVKTLEQTSEYLCKLGLTNTCVTRERIRQIEVSALRGLRFCSEVKNLADFYGKPKNNILISYRDDNSFGYSRENIKSKSNIYEYFLEYDKLDVDRVLEQLYPLQYELIQKFNMYEGQNMSYDEMQCIINVIMPKIRIKLSRISKQKKKV